MPSAAKYLFDGLIEYLEGVCIEAEDRTKLHVRGIEEYLEVRRRSAATRSIFVNCILEDHIPTEVMEHSHVQKLTLAGMTLICIHNVSFSYSNLQFVPCSRRAFRIYSRIITRGLKGSTDIILSRL